MPTRHQRGAKRVRFAALAVLCTSGNVAFADLAGGRDKLIAGDYKTAISELGKVTGKDRNAARIVLAQAQLATGDYQTAEATITPIAQGSGAQTIEAHLVLDQIRRTTGRNALART